jgi:hypothetical protein
MCEDFNALLSLPTAINLYLCVMLFRIVTWIFVIGFLYRILSRFIFPVVRITSNTSDRLRQMQDQLNEMNRKMANDNKPKVKKDGDYIDYEEVR